ncbi:diguanylate cyclase [Candidatus Peregrinibacteria bacterium]|nr:diguanylate cyclase [Candidatus Peregrinibacteria bacterium]
MCFRDPENSAVTRFLVYKNGEPLPPGEAETSERHLYEKALQKVEGLIADAFEEVLSLSLEESPFFVPGEDNSLWLDKEGGPTGALLELIARASEEIIRFVRYTYPENRADSFCGDLEGSKIPDFIKYSAILSLQAFINRAKTEKVLEGSGYDSLMAGFIHVGNQSGTKLYKKVQQDILREMGENQDVQTVMLFIDLDYFGPVNKQYGQDVGDEALVHVSEIITSALRTRNGDVRVRFGGEEIGVIFRHTSGEQALPPALRIRGMLEENPLYLMRHVRAEGGNDGNGKLHVIDCQRFNELRKRNGVISYEEGRGLKLVLHDPRDTDFHIVLLRIPLTASIGVADFPDTEEDVFDRTRQEADGQMVVAKKSGRNRVSYRGEIVEATEGEEES